MDFDSFSHGQIRSKLWLANRIDSYLGKKVVILGSWHNILSFIFKIRGCTSHFTGIDINPEVKNIADKICNTWMIDGSVENLTGDANNISIDYDTIINCSSEHMTTEWFDKIKPGTLICIQSSNMVDPGHPWYIVTPSPNIESFKQKYNLSETLFLDTLRIQYDGWGYDRYMIIGYK